MNMPRSQKVSADARNTLKSLNGLIVDFNIGNRVNDKVNCKIQTRSQPQDNKWDAFSVYEDPRGTNVCHVGEIEEEPIAGRTTLKQSAVISPQVRQILESCPDILFKSDNQLRKGLR